MSADIGNPLVFFETDALNVSATSPTWPEGMPAKNVNDAARALQGAIKRFWDRINFTLTSTGSAANYVLTYTIAPDGLYDGQRFAWTAHIDNTAVPTLNINGLGAKTIRRISGGVLTDLGAGEIQSSALIEVAYNVAGNTWIFLNPPTSSELATDTTPGSVQLATRQEVELAAAGNTHVPTVDSLSMLFIRGSDVAGAASIVLDEGGFFHITGADWSATPCTSITFTDPSANGRPSLLYFEGIGKLVNSGSLVLPSGADIDVAAGDICRIIQDAGPITLVTDYQPASGKPLVGGNFINVYKTVDFSIANNTVLAADTELFFTAKAGKTYNIHGFLSLLCAGNEGFKLGFIASTVLGSVRATWDGHNSSGVSFGNSVQVIGQIDDQTSSAAEVYTGNLDAVIVGGAADSVVSISWAKNSVSASATTVSKDSYISYQER